MYVFFILKLIGVVSVILKILKHFIVLSRKCLTDIIPMNNLSKNWVLHLSVT